MGAWLATHRFLAHLVARGHAVDVVHNHRCPPAGWELDGVRVLAHPTNLDVAVAIADVVVSHLGDQQRAARLAAKWGKPSVRVVHSADGSCAEKLAEFPPALTVFNSHATRRQIGWDGPSIVAHPPVDLTALRTIPGEHVTLVNLSGPKGGGLFWRLARCSPHRRFLGVKGGYGAQLLEQWPNTTVIPNTPNMRDDVYRRTRVLLMPSDRESWGMVGVEAMASGIPVIAHPTDGLRESLGPAGIFVDRADGQAWLDALDRLDDPAEWANASARAVARADELDPATSLDLFATAVEALCVS